MNFSTLTQIIGWTGTFLIVLAYLLVSNKKVDASGKSYQLMNLLGAVGVGINVWHHHAWPALGLQIVWIMIALISILKNIFRNWSAHIKSEQ